MLSGNGKHRRPRQAPALVVAAGVTGSAIAIPLLGATSAGAADGGMTWNQLADCESGGNWTSLPGNGHYGGLQLSSTQWVAYGGTAYADSPEEATRGQQIAVAEKLLAAEGPAAFGGCAKEAALFLSPGGTDGTHGGTGQDDGSRDPASSDAPDPSATPGAPESSAPGDDGSQDPDASPSGDSSASPSASDDQDGTGGKGGKGAKGADGTGTGKSETGEKGDKSGSAGDASDGADSSGSGRHRGQTADEGRGDGRSDDATGRHVSRGDAGRGDSDGRHYVVRPGDNLSVIADSHGVDGGWPALYDGNKRVVGSDPDLILPGQTLDLGLGKAAQSDADAR